MIVEGLKGIGSSLPLGGGGGGGGGPGGMGPGGPGGPGFMGMGGAGGGGMGSKYSKTNHSFYCVLEYVLIESCYSLASYDIVRNLQAGAEPMNNISCRRHMRIVIYFLDDDIKNKFLEDLRGFGRSVVYD